MHDGDVRCAVVPKVGKSTQHVLQISVFGLIINGDDTIISLHKVAVFYLPRDISSINNFKRIIYLFDVEHLGVINQGDHFPDNVKFPDNSLAVHGTLPRHSAC